MTLDEFRERTKHLPGNMPILVQSPGQCHDYIEGRLGIQDVIHDKNWSWSDADVAPDSFDKQEAICFFHLR